MNIKKYGVLLASISFYSAHAGDKISLSSLMHTAQTCATQFKQIPYFELYSTYVTHITRHLHHAQTLCMQYIRAITNTPYAQELFPYVCIFVPIALLKIEAFRLARRPIIPSTPDSEQPNPEASISEQTIEPIISPDIISELPAKQYSQELNIYRLIARIYQKN